MRKLVIIFATVALAAGIATGALAQGIDGTLRGEVDDSKGGIIAGAKVTITNEQTGLERSQETSSAGTFNFPNLLVGTYTVTVEYQGFKKFVRKGLEIKANQVSEVKISMEIGIVTETVEVTANTELVQTTTSNLATSWDTRAATQIPFTSLNFSGDPQNLATLMPGTTTQSGGVEGVGGSIGGNRPRDNNFVLDGVDNNNVIVTGPNQPVIPDSIAEFTLVTNQFSAEYGHSTAGQFILNTKSGTNNVHGNAFWFVNNRSFNSLDNVQKSGILSGQLAGKPRLDQNRGGGTIGGPILKDKWFIFGAYQFTNQGQASVPSGGIEGPTASGYAALNGLAGSAGSGVSASQVAILSSNVPPAPVRDRSVNVVNRATGTAVPIDVGFVVPSAPNFFNQHDFAINTDVNTRQHRFSGRFLYDRFRSPIVPAFPLPQFVGSTVVDARSVTFSDVYTIRPRVVNEFRSGYRRFVQGRAVPNVAPPSTLDVFPNFVLNDLGANIGPFGDDPQSNTINTYQWSDNLSISRGAHDFKVGAQVQLWLVPQSFLPRSRGEYSYSSLDDFVKDIVPNIPGVTGGLALRGVGGGYFAGNQKAYYGFFQDDWKATSRLTLNLGIRYEYSTNPRDSALQTINSIANLPNPTTPGLPPLLFNVPATDRNNWGPRVGFAYDVFGNHKTSLRGGFAVAYDVLFQNLATLQLPPQLQQELDPGQACNLPTRPAYCMPDPANPGRFIPNPNGPFIGGGGLPNSAPTGAGLTQAQARSGTQSLIVDSVDPKTFTWTLGVQREFLTDWSVEFRYVGTRGISLPVQIRRNAATVPPASAFLPTFFRTSDVPTNFPTTANNLAAFQALAVRPYRVDGFAGNVTAFDPKGQSTYHGGSIDLNRRLTGLGRWGNGLLLKANYTYSKEIDNSTNELFTSLVNPRRAEDGTNLRNERSRGAIDHTHKFALAFVYEFPKYGGSSALLKGLLSGWQWNGAYIAETGQPITALSYIDSNGNGDSAGDRGILNPNFTNPLTTTDVNVVCRTGAGATTVTIVAPGACSSSAFILGYVADGPGTDRTAQFVRARPGAQTNIGRNTLISAGINNWNMSFFKRTNITERKYVEFRTEMINAFNHPEPILGGGTIDRLFTNARDLGQPMNFVGNNPLFMKADQNFSTGFRFITFGVKLFF